MPSLGSLNVTIQVQRRKLLPMQPGSAEPQHAYTTVITTRAEPMTLGVKEFARVEIDGKQATHTFMFQYSAIPFDTRDRIRDVRGNLYQILSVDNVGLQNRWLKVHCAAQGHESLPAAR